MGIGEVFKLMGNVLKLDYSDYCTNLLIYQITEILHFQWVNFVVLKLYLNKPVSKKQRRNNFGHKKVEKSHYQQTSTRKKVKRTTSANGKSYQVEIWIYTKE